MRLRKDMRVSALRCLLPLLFLVWPSLMPSQTISNNFYTARRMLFTGLANVASGDLNKDGKPDLVIWSFGVPQTGTVSAVVWLNIGSGNFTNGGQQIAVNPTTTPALADVNADGIPDLIYGDPTNGGVLDVAFGTGQGTFAAPTSYTGLFSPDDGNPVIVGDFNGDGKPDIAWSRNANGGGSAVCVFLNTGNGTFGPVTTYFMGTSPNALAVADMNRDGIQDLVVQNQAPTGDVRIFYGSTSGTFRAGAVVPFNSPSGTAVGDLNGDGIPDIVVGSVTDQFFHHGLTVLTGHADGSFTSQLIRNFLGPITSLMLRDLNGDGKLDLCLTEQNAALFNPGGFFDQSYLAIYSGNGNGTFQNPRTYNIDSDPVNVIAADIYGDGRPALITANANTQDISILRSDVPGFYVAAPITLSPHSEGMVTADFNHGIMDMAVVNDPTCKAPCNGTITVFFGTGHGWFGAGQSYPIGMHGSGIAAGDLNGDGVLDLVVTNNTAGDNSDVSVLLGNANGTFQAAHNFVLGISSSDVFLTDLNRDKKLDLVTNNGVALGTGTGSFGSLLPYTALGSAPVTHIAVADFNQDGIMDVAASDEPGPAGGPNDLSILIGEGSGHFTVVQSQNVGTVIQSLAVGKMNGDALPDLVASYAAPINGQIAVFLGQGGGRLATVGGTGYFTLAIESAGWSVALEDMNNDGFTDVVVTAGSNISADVILNNLIVVPGTGNGTLSSLTEKAFTALSGIRSRIAIADLDNDGRKDVLVTNDLGVSRALNIGSHIP